MTHIILPSVIAVLALISAIAPLILIKRQDKQIENEQNNVKPFCVSEYYSRTEKIALDILERRKPADKTITLWWGLDGLRLNEDGTTEWISRKKPDPIKQRAESGCGGTGGAMHTGYGFIYCPHVSMAQYSYPLYDRLNGQKAALQIQAAQFAQNRAFINAVQCCCANVARDISGKIIREY